VWQSATAGWPKWEITVTPGLLMSGKSFRPIHGRALEQGGVGGGSLFKRDCGHGRYWFTLSRPDHRQSDKINHLPKKLVHAGLQVYDILMRKWA
jgi:hypothetical protein